MNADVQFTAISCIIAAVAGRAAHLGVLLATMVALLLAAPAAFGAGYIVNSTSDADISAGCPFVTVGEQPNPNDPTTICTLRGAINLADTNGEGNHGTHDYCGSDDSDYIQPDVSGPIHVATPLPPLQGIYIEAGYSPQHHLELVGGANGEGADFPGLVLAGNHDDVGRVSVHGFSDGFVITGQYGMVEEGYAGIAPDATAAPAVPNSGSGIVVKAGAANACIGEPDYESATYASGNAKWGIDLEPGSGPTYVSTPRVGVDRTETTAIPNGLGGILVESDGNRIGGTLPCSSPAIQGTTDFECTRALVSGNHGPGIVLADGTSANTIAHTTVGLDRTLRTALPNTGDGIQAGGADQVIGRPTTPGRVTVSGNAGNGIVLSGQRARLTNVAVGTDSDASTAVPNGLDGILASDALQAEGDHKLVASVVSGNAGNGIELRQSHNTIISTTVGRGADQATPIGNGRNGILVLRGPQTIGGFQDNLVADNHDAGVNVSSLLPGIVPTGVNVAMNEFADNGGLAIDLGGDGVTPNHGPAPGDGPNTLLNHPVLTSASSAGGTSAFHGVVDAVPNTIYSLWLYRSASCDPSGSGEAEVRASQGPLTTDANGRAYITVTQPAAWQQGDVLTALIGDNQGNTSEFSPCITTGGGVDLSVSQAVTAASTSANHAYELVIGVTNHGPSKATSVVVTETLPAGTTVIAPATGCEAPAAGAIRCATPDLDAGGHAELHFLLQTATPQTVSNQVAVAADQVDTNTADNTSDLAIAVGPDPLKSPAGASGSLNGPGPVFAQSLRVDRVTTPVQARLPDGTVIDVTKFALVPVGTVVAADDTIARITAALPTGAAAPTISGIFRDSSFRLRQSASENGVTEARIDTPLQCGGARAKTRAPTSQLLRRRRRHLWGSGKGTWRIRGRYVTAAVRGTKWRVTDTCTSSEVFVREGTVVAEGVGTVTPASATVTAGHRVTFQPVHR